MFKKLFNTAQDGAVRKPKPADVKAFCDTATQGDSVAKLQKFIDAYGKENIDSLCPETGYTALMRAAQHGNIDNCRFLLWNGANANAQDKDGWSVLMVAINQNRREAVELLLENKADVNARNLTQGTALMAAAREGNEGLVTLLLEKGADPRLVNVAQQNAAAVARTHSLGDAAHERVARQIEQAIAAANLAEAGARAAALQEAAGEIALGLQGGLEKPLSISRPLTLLR